jgi:hypothetical protein
LTVAHASGQLDHRQLGNEHGPGRLQALDDRGIEVEHLAAEGSRAPGGRNALRGGQQVLRAVRDAVQETAPPTGRDLVLGVPGLPQGPVACHGHDGVVARPEPFQALQKGLGELHG